MFRKLNNYEGWLRRKFKKLAPEITAVEALEY